jgi:hypothetical protein
MRCIGTKLHAMVTASQRRAGWADRLLDQPCNDQYKQRINGHQATSIQKNRLCRLPIFK